MIISELSAATTPSRKEASARTASASPLRTAATVSSGVANSTSVAPLSATYPAWMVPGGVNEPLTVAERDAMRELVPEGLDIAKRTYAFYKDQVVKNFAEEIRHFGTAPTMFLSLVSPKGELEHYDGSIRIKEAKGNIVEDMVPTDDYQRVIGEAVEPYSYRKFPDFKPIGIGITDGPWAAGANDHARVLSNTLLHTCGHDGRFCNQ